MADLRMVESVRSVVKLEADSSGNIEPVEIYRRADGKKRRGTRLLRPMDRVMRGIVRAQQTVATTYLERHEKSNNKRRDGWLRDLGNNVYRASMKGPKALKLNRLIFPD
jgi:uncharacterized protein DUF6312